MKIVLLWVYLCSSAFACDLYLERPEVAEHQFFDLNVLDEYTLGVAVEVTSKDLKNRIQSLLPKLNFAQENGNEAILKVFNQKPLIFYPIKNISQSLRNSYLVKQDFNKTEYFSFIVYTNCVID